MRYVLVLAIGWVGCMGAAWAQEPPAEPSLTPSQQLSQAEDLVGAHYEDGALDLLRRVVARRAEDEASAAKAQYHIGELLLLNYHRANEAEPELRKVVAEFPGQGNEVNSARVRLLEICVDQKRWNEVLALADAVSADGRAVKANSDLVAWAHLHVGRMHETVAKAAELSEAMEECLSRRSAAAEAYMRAAATAAGTAPGEEAIKRLGDMLCNEHRYTEQEATRSSAWHGLARGYLAAGLSVPTVPANADVASFALRAEQCAGTLLRLGRFAESHHRDDQAVAWYRLAVGLAGCPAAAEAEAAERVASLLSRRGVDWVERWRNYMVAPDSLWDPTEGIVTSQVGFAPGRVSDNAGGVSARASALGAFLLKEKRYAEARARFAEALQSAATPRERGNALSGLARSVFLEREVLHQQGDYAGVRALVAQARNTAAQASDAWLAEALNGKDGEAHSATEEAILTWKDLFGRQEALDTAVRFVDEFTKADASTSKIAFARLMHARALGLWNYRPAEAAAMVLELAGELAETEDSVLEVIRIHCLLDASAFIAGAGDPHGALAHLDSVREAHPRRYDAAISGQRALIRTFYLAADGSASE